MWACVASEGKETRMEEEVPEGFALENVRLRADLIWPALFSAWT